MPSTPAFPGIPAAPPLVGVTCCTRLEGENRRHWAGEKYLTALSDGAHALPLLVPSLAGRIALDALIARLDGLLVTGSPSNVEPHHYDGAPSQPGTLHDAERDALALPLIRAAIAAELPVLAICRGLQELNVALGGTLYQRVHEVPGRLDHRAPEGTMEIRYAHRAHEVRLTPGGFLAGLAGRGEIMVNSLHSQGIDRLAPGLAVEATAPDGQIEAVRLPEARFVLAVQWHPEYRVLDNPVSRALFGAFGEACRERAARLSRAARYDRAAG